MWVSDRSGMRVRSDVALWGLTLIAVSVVLTGGWDNSPDLLTHHTENQYVRAAIFRFHAHAIPSCTPFIAPAKNNNARLVPRQLADDSGNWLRLTEKISPQETGACNTTLKQMATPRCLPITGWLHLAL